MMIGSKGDMGLCYHENTLSLLENRTNTCCFRKNGDRR